MRPARCDPASRRQTLQRSETIVAAAQELRAGREIAYFACCLMNTMIHRAVKHDARADARTDGDRDEAARAFARAEAPLAQGRQVDVVLDEDGQAETVLEQLAQRQIAPVELG